MFEDRMAMRIFGSKCEDVINTWRNVHNKKRHNLHSSTCIMRMIRSKGTCWARHATRMGEVRNTKFWSIDLKERDLLGKLGVDGWIGPNIERILKESIPATTNSTLKDSLHDICYTSQGHSQTAHKTRPTAC
jgi:hypothetical protein